MMDNMFGEDAALMDVVVDALLESIVVIEIKASRGFYERTRDVLRDGLLKSVRLNIGTRESVVKVSSFSTRSLIKRCRSMRCKGVLGCLE
jgi:hypothetical protein